MCIRTEKASEETHASSSKFRGDQSCEQNSELQLVSFGESFETVSSYGIKVDKISNQNFVTIKLSLNVICTIKFNLPLNTRIMKRVIN